MSEELNPCPQCGALPCDWVDNPPTRPAANVEAEPVAFVWPTDRIEATFRKASERHGFLESLFAVASEGARIKVEAGLLYPASALEQVRKDALEDRNLLLTCIKIEANRWPENEDVQAAIASLMRRIENLKDQANG